MGLFYLTRDLDQGLTYQNIELENTSIDVDQSLRVKYVTITIRLGKPAELPSVYALCNTENIALILTL